MERREILVVVELAAGDGGLVGVENRLHVREARDKRVEDEITRARHGDKGPRRHRERIPEALESLGLESGMDAPLPGQLAVMVERRVERHMGVGHVMREEGREVLDVVARVGRFLRERLDQLHVHLLRAPRQQPVFVDELPPEPLHSLVEVARQLPERRGAVRVHVDEVAR